MPRRTRKTALRAARKAEIDKAALYKPLNAHRKEVRLLTIIPNEFAEDIHCSLARVSLDDAPSYEALSYAWGSPQCTRQIYLDEVPYAVTNNLESALRHLRYLDRPRVLWIDALCINQRDLLERNSQITHMSDVYERASEVVAWLGDEYEHSDLAFDAFEALPNSDQIHWDAENNPMLQRVSVNPEYLTAVCQLLDRSWWHRVWTVQESILGRSLRFYCGHRQICANSLFAVAKSYFKHRTSCCHDQLGVFRRTHTFPYLEALHALYQIRQTRNIYKLQNLIASYRSRRCADPRDKIYGLLGLASGEEVNLIRPDYSIPTPEVYEQVSLRLIEKSRSLQILSQVYPRHMNPIGIETIKLPSWVPDWTSKGSYHQHIHLRIRLDRNHDYMASAGSFASIKSIKQGKIALRARLFSSFSVLSHAHDSEPYYNYDIFNEWETLARTTKQFDQLYADSASTTYYDAYWQTLCCSIAPKIDLNDIPLGSINSTFTVAQLKQFSEYVTASTKMRKLFISKDEGWLGLAPMDAENGDRIALLEGGSVPYILRPVSGDGTEYEFIGDAYVHGIMDGEAWKVDDLVDIVLV
ncbi:HET domain containing protein [Hyaloscypha variabilis]